VIYLATASGPAARTAIEQGSLGQLVPPNAGNRLVPGATWAADNGCYSGDWNPTGCNGVDGTYLAYGPDRNLPRLHRFLRLTHTQPTLGLEGLG